MDIVTKTFEISDVIKDNRNLNDILNAAIQELGELATEISIETGYRLAPPGKDGIIGEAIDTIVCLLDIIHKHDSNITKDELERIAEIKLNKWVSKSKIRDEQKETN